MSGGTNQSALRSVIDVLNRILRGGDDTRIRALWRVLVIAVVISQLQELVAVTVVGVLGLKGRVPFGVAQAVSFGILLVAWAVYIDHRSLSDYGFSLSWSWMLDGVVGFGAVLSGFGIWLGLGSLMGWANVELAMTSPDGLLLLGLGAFLLGTALNVWVQESIFTGMVLKNAAEGLSSRGVTATQAVIGAWVVAVFFFTVLHGRTGLGQIVNLLIVLGLYGLLYVQTGELALSIGVHTGVNYAGGVLVVSPSLAGNRPSFVEVSNTLSGALGSLNDGAVPHVIIAYLLVLGWLRLRGRAWSVTTELAYWCER